MDETFDPNEVNRSRAISQNEVIGFTMSVIDSDEDNKRNSFLGSVDTAGHQANEGYLNADHFGALVLKSAPTE